MGSVIHIAEVAAILAVAYGLGWIIGYVVHRLVAPKPAVVAAVPAERIAAVTAPADALVKAPVIEPVPQATPPAAAEPEPAKSAPAEAVAASEPEPVAVTPEAAALIESEPAVAPLMPVAIPEVEPPPPMKVEPVAPLPKPAPEPEPIAEPEPVLTATPAVKPGEAWSGEVRGRRAAAAAPVAEAPVEPVVEPAPQLDVPLTLDLGPVGPDSTYGEPVVPPPAAAPVDEDAAMRAIEGGWSRIGARALPDSPELSDVGAAVAAAQSAVEQVLAKAGIDAGASGETARPKGLPRPRNGMRDDLKRIDGLGALDESTLNNQGVFHFDQIAGWSDAQVLWMENHVFARGRIGRENWQQQARDLASAAAG